MVLVGPLAHVPPRFAEDGGGRHHVDAVDAGQVHSRHAEQRFAHVKLRGIALLPSAPPLAGLLRQIGPRAAVGPLLQVLLQALIAFGDLLLAKFVAILFLSEHKQQVFLPVPLQAARDLFCPRLDPYITQRCQGLWVTLASQNGLDDGLPRHPAQIADHVGQLHVHLRQHLLHTLDVPPRALHQVVPLPPVSPQPANLLRRSERVAQQTIGVQLHQPLTLLDVGLLTRQILRVSRVHQVHFEPGFLQNVVHRSPVHPRGLHSDGANATLLQPRRHFFQFHRGASKLPYRPAIPRRGHGHIVGFVADIDPRGIRMHHLQAQVLRLDFPCHLPALLPVHLVPAAPRGAGLGWGGLLGGLPCGGLLVASHGILTSFLRDQPGSARWAKTTQSLHRGRAVSFFKENAATIYATANTGATLYIGQKRSKEKTALAAEPGCPADCKWETRSDARNLAEFLSRATTRRVVGRSIASPGRVPCMVSRRLLTSPTSCA